MPESLLFLTGRLAEERLRATLGEVGLPSGSWRVANIGIKVAALMTEAIVRNRLHDLGGADRVIVPGRSRMDLASLAAHYGVPFVRGPDEIIDLPQYLGRGGKPPDLTRHDLRIFAEIVEAPSLSVEQLLARARRHAAAGADVIDIGCQPDTPFPHLEQVVAAIKAEGLVVSVDSGDVSELRRAALAGADYVLSLDETSLDAVAGTRCVPILVPKPHGCLASLLSAIDAATARGIPHIADPVLDPIHFGFMASLERYAELRRLRPDVEILMGTGNLTELTDADSQGVTALLAGICSELRIRNVLIVQVSPHTRRTVEEHDAARRLMFRAREDGALPKGYGGGLLSLHELVAFPQSVADIAASAASVRDLNYRIQVSADGIHVYNRERHLVSSEPFGLFPQLGVEDDGSHAFYLGYELAKAEIAHALAKRYVQDQSLDWGIAADKRAEDLTRHSVEGATLKAKAKEAAARREAARAEAEDRTPLAPPAVPSSETSDD
jgi:dihydropteroate synthase